MPEHDAAVVARARSGDMEAFRLLVERHSRNVYTVAYRVTGNCHDAEDIVQETFLKAYRQLDRFESRSSFSTWVHRIAMNCAIDFLRSRSRREQPETHETLEDLAAAAPSSHDAPMIAADRLVASAEIGQRIRTAMARLSPLERAAFVLRHFEGQSIDEISRALGVRQNAAKHCIFRAVRKMRVALEAFVE
jgi:RNA polymerase sigma-70 factor (ECF subfamily)